jgi:hypothetical protein
MDVYSRGVCHPLLAAIYLLATRPPHGGRVVSGSMWYTPFMAAMAIQSSSRGLQGVTLKAKQDAFLAAYQECGTILGALSVLDDSHKTYVGRSTVWHWRKDRAFAERFEAAHENFVDSLEAIAIERVHSPKGNTGGDTLCMFLLNGHRPWRYRPQGANDQSDTKSLLSEIRLKLSASREGIEVSVSTEERPLSQPDDESGIIEAEA